MRKEEDKEGGGISTLVSWTQTEGLLVVVYQVVVSAGC